MTPTSCARGLGRSCVTLAILVTVGPGTALESPKCPRSPDGGQSLGLHVFHGRVGTNRQRRPGVTLERSSTPKLRSTRENKLPGVNKSKRERTENSTKAAPHKGVNVTAARPKVVEEHLSPRACWPDGPTAHQVGPWSMNLVHGPWSMVRGPGQSGGGAAPLGRIHSKDRNRTCYQGWGGPN